MFDLSNTPIIYFARCCDEDEDEEIPKETGEMERKGKLEEEEEEGGRQKHGAKNECGTAAGRSVRREDCTEEKM